MKRIILFIVAISISSVGGAMSVFSMGKICAFSEIRAVVTKNGEPVSGLKIIREIEWKKTQTEETTTNEKGEFHFPALYVKSMSKFLPSEIVIPQALIVEIDGKESEIWINTKRDAEENSELGGEPLSLTCELTESRQIYNDFGSLLSTNCKWK